jgi:hypothetical protein
VSRTAERIAEELRSLSAEDLRAIRGLLDELVAKSSPQSELYGEAMSDEDIADAARVTFSALDADESKA